MRMQLTVTISVAKGKQAIVDGSLARLMQNLVGALHPEAAPCAPTGKRGGFCVFDLPDPAQIPVICELLFQGLDAEAHRGGAGGGNPGTLTAHHRGPIGAARHRSHPEAGLAGGGR